MTASPQRIVSLLPGATEVVAALGAGGRLVGVSHECDHPPWVTALPRVTTSPIDVTLAGSLIDAEVRRLMEEGQPVVALEAERLVELRPDLLVTQTLCNVCAVGDGEVHRLADLLDPPPATFTMTGTTVAGVLEDITRLGALLDLADDAEELVLGMKCQMKRAGMGAPVPPPRVLAIEWLDPLYLAGHWVPELIVAAGGQDVGAEPGARSARREWRDIAALEWDLVVILLCGFGVERSVRELDEFLEEVGDGEAELLLQRSPVWVMDGNTWTSRAGPRLPGAARRFRAAIQGREVPGLVKYKWVDHRT